ncbi:hypothetical protein HDV05_006852 [Chytridiales sp. JEL 0842]|nr:hypothetical protein HDV05_006852 [Chytridiales sp. JEL 0842]
MTALEVTWQKADLGVALCSFEPRNSDELKIENDDEIVLAEIADTWAWGTNMRTGQKGWLPLAVLKRISNPPKRKSTHNSSTSGASSSSKYTSEISKPSSPVPLPPPKDEESFAPPPVSTVPLAHSIIANEDALRNAISLFPLPSETIQGSDQVDGPKDALYVKNLSPVSDSPPRLDTPIDDSRLEIPLLDHQEDVNESSAVVDVHQIPENSSNETFSNVKPAVALYDYMPNTPDGLSITAGDALVIIQESGDWCWAENSRTSLLGWVPTMNISYSAPPPTEPIIYVEPAEEQMRKISIVSSTVSENVKSDTSDNPAAGVSIRLKSKATQKVSEQVAVYPFEPRSRDEMMIAPGDKVIIGESQDDGWAWGTNLRTAAKGWFPLVVLQQEGDNAKPNEDVSSLDPPSASLVEIADDRDVNPSPSKIETQVDQQIPMIEASQKPEDVDPEKQMELLDAELMNGKIDVQQYLQQKNELMQRIKARNNEAVNM